MIFAMSTIELKNEIITRISAIDDDEFLTAIKTILDYRKKEPFIYLTKEEEDELMMASNEGKNGQYTLQSVMDKKVEEWLKEK
jgi:hypothetical protein